MAGQAVRQLSHHPPGAWWLLGWQSAQRLLGQGPGWLTRCPVAMLGQALALVLLLLLEGLQGQGKAARPGLGWGWHKAGASLQGHQNPEPGRLGL